MKPDDLRHGLLALILSIVSTVVILDVGLSDGQEAVALVVSTAVIVVVSLFAGLVLLGRWTGSEVAIAALPRFDERPDGFSTAWIRPRDWQRRTWIPVASIVVGSTFAAVGEHDLVELIGIAGFAAMTAAAFGGVAGLVIRRTLSSRVELKGRVWTVDGESVVITRPSEQIAVTPIGGVVRLRVSGDGSSVDAWADAPLIDALATRLRSLPDIEGDRDDVPEGLRRLGESEG